MNYRSVLITFGLLALVPFAALAQTSLPLTTTRIVVNTESLPPFTDVLEVPTADDFRLTVTDFGVVDTPVAPAASVRLLGFDRQGTLVIDTDTPGVQTVSLPAGELTLALVVAVATQAEAASVGFELRRNGADEDLYRTVQPFTSVEQTLNPSSITESFTATADGVHRFAIVDTAFPDEFEDARAIVLDGPGGNVLGLLDADTPLDVMLSAGDSPEITIVLTRRNESDRATARLTVTDDAANVVFDKFLEAGDYSELVRLEIADFPESGDARIRLTDFMFPIAIDGLVGQLRTQSEALLIAPNTPVTVASGGGPATLLVAATPGVTGAVGVRVDAGDDVVLDTLLTLEPQPEFNAAAVIESAFEVATEGQVTVEVRDFAAPQAFDQVVAAVIRDGAIAAELQAAGVVSFVAQPGEYLLSVVGVFDSPALGTLGVSVTDSEGTALLEQSDSAGGMLMSDTLTLDSTRRVRVSGSDLAIPAGLDAFSVTLTRGANILGTLFGGGSFDVTLEQGDYSINVVANPSANQTFGVYQVSVADVPDAPVVTLAASATSVAAGGGVTLTWSSQNANSCAATGAWNGDRPVSGSESIASVNANSEFRLECTGGGGVSSATVSVSVRAGSTVSGGGGVRVWSCLVLSLFPIVRLLSCREFQQGCSTL